MKRRESAGLTLAAMAVAVGGLVLAASPALATPGACPPSEAQSTCGAGPSGPVSPGSPLSFSTGPIYDGGSTAAGAFHSREVAAGSFTADASGAVSGSVTVPDLPAGSHEFTLSGRKNGKAVVFALTFTVAAGSTAAGGAGTSSSATGGTSAAGSSGDSGSSLPFTGADVLPMLGAGGVLVIVGGAAVVVGRRRRAGAVAATGTELTD